MYIYIYKSVRTGHNPKCKFYKIFVKQNTPFDAHNRNRRKIYRRILFNNKKYKYWNGEGLPLRLRE